MTKVLKIEVLAGATVQCEEFLKLPALETAFQNVGALPYFHSLCRLFSLQQSNLGVVQIQYSFEDGSSVCQFDIKCSAFFEDPVVEQMYADWNSSKDALEFGPVCAFRRGMCIGLINQKDLILCIGNCKFFYGEEAEILSSSQVLLSEKANGEYSMLSSTQNDKGEVTWLTFGSKNVRLTLPFDHTRPLNTLQAMHAFQAVLEGQSRGRFSFVFEMIPLWLPIVDDAMISVLKTGCTILGEQVGVHAHIFDGYVSAHIRLFSVLKHDVLTTQVGCDLRIVSTLLPHHAMVTYQSFALPGQMEECSKALLDIASGSIEKHGEGVVVYCFDAQSQCTKMLKFKCQEYALDRFLRGQLSRLASEFARGRVFSDQQLAEESQRIQISLQRALENQFSRVNSTRGQARVELVPSLVAFLHRHQNTVYCHDFNDQFVTLLSVVQERKEAYRALIPVPQEGVDELLVKWETLLATHGEILETLRVKEVKDMAEEMASTWTRMGGRAKFAMIGISASPGGGKTALLHALQQALLPVSSVICDRDAYCIQNPAQTQGKVIHQLWMKDIQCALEGNHVVLVGNTFSGTFASQLEQNHTPHKLLLFALEEHAYNTVTDRNAAFHVLCLRRLRERREQFSDGSTLTMKVGSKIVLNKYFTSFPDPQVLKHRLKNKSCVLFSPLLEQQTPTSSKDLVKDLGELKSWAIQASPTAASSVRNGLADYVTSSVLLKKNLLFIGLLPHTPTAHWLCALADADLMRTDGHITLAYKPADETLALPLFQAHNTYDSLVATSLVTVSLTNERMGKDRLQFVSIRGACPDLFSLSENPPHVTLGSTNSALLPAVTSGQVLKQLLHDAPQQQQQGDGFVQIGKYFVWTTPLDPPPLYVGTITFNYREKEKEAPTSDGGLTRLKSSSPLSPPTPNSPKKLEKSSSKKKKPSVVEKEEDERRSESCVVLESSTCHSLVWLHPSVDTCRMLQKALRQPVDPSLCQLVVRYPVVEKGSTHPDVKRESTRRLKLVGFTFSLELVVRKSLSEDSDALRVLVGVDSNVFVILRSDNLETLPFGEVAPIVNTMDFNKLGIQTIQARSGESIWIWLSKLDRQICLKQF